MTERIDPMYGQIPILVRELAYAYIPSIESALAGIEDMKKAYKDYSRNKWVQKIKANYRRNKRKRRRCKKK